MATDKLIRRSGLTHSIAVEAVGVETTGSVTGVFHPGETVTGGTSSETGTFVAFDSAGDKIFLADVSGTFSNTETLTGGESGATISTGTVSQATEFSSYITIGRLKNQLTWGDERGVETITDFDTAENDFFDQITNGRTGTLSGEGWLDHTNEGIQALHGAYASNATAKIKVVRTTIDATSLTDMIRTGFVSRFEIINNENAVDEYRFDFAVTARPTS